MHIKIGFVYDILLLYTDKVIAEIIPESCLQSHNHSRFKQQTITLIVRGTVQF